MEPLLTLTTTLMAPLTTWATPTLAKVCQQDSLRLVSCDLTPAVCPETPPPPFNSNLLSGATYNIIRVPPTKKSPEETLEGATVLCSIPSVDKTKPSYYHSFGESRLAETGSAYLYSGLSG